MNIFISDRQKNIFQKIEQSGELVFSCGARGAIANLVGQFKVRRNHLNEDQLDVGDGTCHVHIDWSRVKRFEVGLLHGEGVLTFFDTEEVLFRFYRLEGFFSEEITSLPKNIID